MATDLSQLITDFYSYFLGLYHQSKTQPPSAGGVQPTTPPAAAQPTPGAASASAFIAFESIGTPMTPEMFKLRSGDFDPGLVLQQFTLRANMIPVIDGTSISAPGLLSVDGAYALMLEAAQPLTAADVEALGHIKRSALKDFDNSASNYSIPGLNSEFHPAVPGPPDWPSPTGAAAWTARTFQQSETVAVKTSAPPSTPVAPSPPPPPDVSASATPTPQWAWRVTPEELTITLRSTEAVAAAVPPQAIAVSPEQALAAHPAVFHPLVENTLAARGPLVAAANAAPQTAGASTPPTALAAAVPAASGEVLVAPGAPAVPVASTSLGLLLRDLYFVPTAARSDTIALRVQELSRRSTPQTVTSTNFKLAFDYCLVQAQRPWLSGGFLKARNWYVPHTKAGEIASGTGLGTGSFEVLPVAAIVVQNLIIEADWSRDDIAILHSSVNLGPFSLIGRSIDEVKNTIVCKGMQIVGWVLEPMPFLPPNTDPTTG